jgi:hypothetical protein
MGRPLLPKREKGLLALPALETASGTTLTAQG